MTSAPAAIASGRARRFGLALLVLAAPVVLADGLVERMAAVGARVEAARAYFRLVEPLLLYLRLPVALLGVLAVVLAPGLAAARLLLRRSRPLDALVLDGAGLLVPLSMLATLGGAWGNGGAGSLGYLPLGLAALAIVALLLVRPRAEAGATGARGFFVWVVLPTLLVATIVAPKIFWEAANGDGAHAFEAARLLLHGHTPFFPAGAGSMAAYPGPNSLLQGFLAAPLLDLLGEDIAALRLSFVLALGLLAAALRGLLPAELRDRPAVNLPLWLALLAAAVALGWSAGYDPYAADLALPAAQDLLLVAFFVAAIGAWIRGERLRFAAFLLLAAITSPGGGLLLLFLPAARLVAGGDGALRRAVVVGLLAAAALALQAMIGILSERFWGMEAGGEHGLRPLLRKLRFIDLLDLRRFLFLVPGGLFPLVVFGRICRVNVEARTVALVALCAFAFFYPLLRTNLHYFAPAMILPLAAWLIALREAPRGRSLALATALAVASLGLSLPRGLGIAEDSRRVGELIDLAAVPGYEDFAPEALRATEALTLLVAPEHDLAVPERLYGASPLALNYHARRAPPTADKIMAIRPATAGAAPGETLVGERAGLAAWVRDRAAWENMRVRKPDDTRGRSFLLCSQERMFGTRELETGRGVIDLRRVFDAMK